MVCAVFASRAGLSAGEMLPGPGEARERARCTPACARVPLQLALGNPSVFLFPTVTSLLC